MGRVTIGDIAEDLLPFTEKGNKVIPIEIVPRKIVEMIIEKCKIDERAVFWNAYITDGVIQEATTIKDYAESLLKQFEEDEE